MESSYTDLASHPSSATSQRHERASLSLLPRVSSTDTARAFLPCRVVTRTKRRCQGSQCCLASEMVFFRSAVAPCLHLQVCFPRSISRGTGTSLGARIIIFWCNTSGRGDSQYTFTCRCPKTSEREPELLTGWVNLGRLFPHSVPQFPHL